MDGFSNVHVFSREELRILTTTPPTPPPPIIFYNVDHEKCNFFSTCGNVIYMHGSHEALSHRTVTVRSPYGPKSYGPVT